MTEPEQPSDLPRLINERADLQADWRALLAMIEDDEHTRRRGFGSDNTVVNHEEVQRLSMAIEAISDEIQDLLPK